jgi:CBS domain-containing protein
MKVKDAMHKGVQWVAPDLPLPTIAQKMQEYDVGVIPVGENDRLVGMVTDRDIALRGVADGKDPAKLTAKDVMTKGVVWCRDTDDVSDAAHLMESKKIRRLPVIDANKRMVGMISLGDVSHAASQKIAAELTKAVSAHHR